MAQQQQGVSIIILDGTNVKLYRWTDPVMGPRTIPDLKTPLAGLTLVDNDKTFSIDTTQKTIQLGDINITSGLVFRVTN